MALDPIRSRLRDAADIARRARSGRELVRALLPPSLLRRRVLNDADPPSQPGSAGDRVERMRRLANRIKAEAISPDGRRVDYRRLAGSALVGDLESAAAGLRSVRPEAFGSDAERVAFWINLYNTLVVHGIVALGIERSVMEVPAFFGTVAYQVGEWTFTPDEIENGVLRRNGPHPATGRRSFGDGDPRSAFAPAAVDPRIHFALVCAARGCPPIGVYSPEHLESELDLAARSFVNGDAVVNHAAKRVEISTLFRYYPDDFGGEEGVAAFVGRNAEGELAGALAEAAAAGYPLWYRPYDWDLNAA